MSLPPGFLDELRNRINLSNVVGRKVVWDMRKSNQAKGDMWAPCPFHHEKTPSFHVDDQKGFYYCFGCHAKGDAVTFIKETENVDFMEAVEILATEAGMPMPSFDPKAKEKTDHRKTLVDVMAEAVNFFRLSLNTQAATHAREYLQRRGLEQKIQDQFEIGFAPDSRSTLLSHLTNKGIALEKLIETGLVINPDDGSAPYDRFRGRIMYPIRDARGNCIAFGGRALDPNARAKYLNSPQTVLFDKGKNLYNHAFARSAVGRGEPLIVAEGYMDVIALSAAGFEGAVAPLGTAITEPQLELLWRISHEPIVALDGDRAGLTAAYRLIDLALPLLGAGRALRFALMPEGQDPDDLLRASGAKAVQGLLETAVPMVELLWRRETEGKVFDSPERRAMLDKTIAQSLGRIHDQNLKRHYIDAVKNLRWKMFAPNNGGYKSNGRPFKVQKLGTHAQSATKSSYLAMADDENAAQFIREATIVAIIISYPQVVDELHDDLIMIDLDTKHLDILLKAVLSKRGETKEQMIEQFKSTSHFDQIESLFTLPHIKILPCLRSYGTYDSALQTLQQELAKLEGVRGLSLELTEFNLTSNGEIDDKDLLRLGLAADAQQRAIKSTQEDKTQYDTAQNGARLNREERDKLDALRNKIKFEKPRK